MRKKDGKKNLVFVGALALLVLASFLFLSKSTSDMSKEDEAITEALITYTALEEATTTNDFVAPVAEVTPVTEPTIIATTTMLIATTTEDEIKEVPPILNITVPFTTQAPLVNWADPRQQDGCEEAVAVMAMAWVKGEGLKTKITPAEFEKRILALSDFQEEKYGEYRDTGLSDMLVWIFQDYFQYDKAVIKDVASSDDILRELEKGNIVLLPMAGQELKTPNFKAPGPPTHMILVKGYDYQTQEFITNDPGTRLGADYRYPATRVYEAIQVYPTGYHQAVLERTRAMLIIPPAAN